MSVTTLSHNNTFAGFIATALRHVEDVSLHDSFDHFANQIEHADCPDWVIIDAAFMRRGGNDVWQYLEKKKVPCLIVDDLLGHLSERIEEGRYPSNTIGVITNEVLAQPTVLKEVLDLVQERVGMPPHAIQRSIHDVLVRYNDIWGMDPDYAHQYGKFAQS